MIRVMLFVFITLFTGQIMAIEEPQYTLIEQSDLFELRAYAPKIIAETTVTGDLDDASSAGFKLIADYIFGNNTARKDIEVNEEGGKKISMTAPVTIENQSQATSTEISMTAPVTMEETGDEWRMHFVMPRQYTMKTIPTPNNSAVTLREVPTSNYAVIKFSWFAGEEKVAKKTTELMAWLARKNITPIGKPQLARYNPPWTLPFFRRNEIMVAY